MWSVQVCTQCAARASHPTFPRFFFAAANSSKEDFSPFQSIGRERSLRQNHRQSLVSQCSASCTHSLTELISGMNRQLNVSDVYNLMEWYTIDVPFSIVSLFWLPRTLPLSQVASRSHIRFCLHAHG